ncbi:MAG: hypothetical protein HOH24_01180 [Chromatiales bacterium]|nr:hypothetical protein [Chromatiales bacterium]
MTNSKALVSGVIMAGYIGSFIAVIELLFRRMSYNHLQQPVLAITALLLFVSWHRVQRR